jgi:hypothetical protein
VGACLPLVLVFLLNWTTVLFVDKSPCGPAVRTSGGGCCCCAADVFDAPLPNVDSSVGVGLLASSWRRRYKTFFYSSLT